MGIRLDIIWLDQELRFGTSEKLSGIAICLRENKFLNELMLE